MAVDADDVDVDEGGAGGPVAFAPVWLVVRLSLDCVDPGVWFAEEADDPATEGRYGGSISAGCGAAPATDGSRLGPDEAEVERCASIVPPLALAPAPAALATTDVPAPPPAPPPTLALSGAVSDADDRECPPAMTSVPDDRGCAITVIVSPSLLSAGSEPLSDTPPPSPAGPVPDAWLVDRDPRSNTATAPCPGAAAAAAAATPLPRRLTTIATPAPPTTSSLSPSGATVCVDGGRSGASAASMLPPLPLYDRGMSKPSTADTRRCDVDADVDDGTDDGGGGTVVAMASRRSSSASRSAARHSHSCRSAVAYSTLTVQDAHGDRWDMRSVPAPHSDTVCWKGYVGVDGSSAWERDGVAPSELSASASASSASLSASPLPLGLAR